MLVKSGNGVGKLLREVSTLLRAVVCSRVSCLGCKDRIVVSKIYLRLPPSTVFKPCCLPRSHATLAQCHPPHHESDVTAHMAGQTWHASKQDPGPNRLETLII